MDLRSSVLVREGGRKILATTIMLHENAVRLSQGRLHRTSSGARGKRCLSVSLPPGGRLAGCECSNLKRM